MSQTTANTPAIASDNQQSAGDFNLGVLGPQIVAVTAVFATLAWAYWGELRSLVNTWSNDPNYSHGFLVPPIVGFMYWWLWPRGEQAARLRPSIWGWVALGAVVGLRSFLLWIGEFWAEQSTIILAVAAITFAYGGWPLFRRVWPAIVFLIFMLPVPQAINNEISLPLQRLASLGSAQLLRLTGLWVLNEGNILIVGGETLEVAAACNGLAMLMSLSATVTAALILIPMANWKRFILLLSVVPIALFCNVLRISGTAWCYHLMGSEQGEQFAHDAAGWLMMPTALVLVLLELAWLSWLVTEESADSTPLATVQRRSGAERLAVESKS